MQTKFPPVALVFIISVLTLYQCTSTGPKSLADLESATGLSFPQAKRFLVQKDLRREGAGGTSLSIEALSDGRLLRIEITTGLNPEQASQTVTERLTMVRSLYANLPSPYPGMVTNTVAVEEALQPRIHNVEIGGAQFPLYILSSNVRHTYGALNRENVVYTGGLCFLYDRSAAALYRLDLFIPVELYTQDDLVSFFAGITSRKGGLEFPDDAEQQSSAPALHLSQAKKDQTLPPDKKTLQCRGCNLILIALEPLGANHVSSYGYPETTTPHLDAFAAEAFLFENAISASSWSLPSFMSMFTSLYPSQHRVTNKYSTYTEEETVLANLADLSPAASTLTDILRQNDYRAAGFTGGASLAGDFGFRSGFELYYDARRFAGLDRTLPMALDWLAEKKEEKFFLFIQGYDVHGRFPLANNFLPKFLKQPYSGPLKGSEEEYWELRDANIEQGGITLSGEDTRFLRAIYDAKIYAADRRLGSFLNSLREQGLLDNSIIIITSGSGNEYNEHGRIDHGFSLYEELIRVPLVIRVPGHQGRIPDQVRTIDIMPTAIDLLGLQVDDPAKKQMQGLSLLPLLKGEHLALKAVSETDYLLQAFKRSIRTDDGWKLIVSLDTEQRELYNLSEDPGEKNNLIQTEGRRAYELEQILFDHIPYQQSH